MSILKLLDGAGVKVLPEHFGNNIHVCFCTLVFPDGSESVGAGKSISDQRSALEVAAYEAVEHHALTLKQEDGHLSCVDAHLLNTMPFPEQNSPDWSLILGGSKAYLTCDIFESIARPEKFVRFPRFLFNPDFVPTDSREIKSLRSLHLHRYSTNSGAACHKTVKEAVLHGVLEVIERDAIGLALLKCIVKDQPEPPVFIEEDQRTPALSKLFSWAQADLNCKLRLIDLTTDLGIPTVLAGLTWLNDPFLTSFGSAAHICPEVAIERAVLEASQIYYADLHYPEERPSIPDDAASLLYRCCLEAGIFDYKCPENKMLLSEWIAINTRYKRLGDPPDKAADWIGAVLNSKGIEIFWRGLRSPIDELPVVVSLIPKLERFHLVARGNWVVPGMRGKAVLST